ncbi:MAG: hypothetical protein WCC70_10020 [Candidatus Aquilonibacter sp.]
MDYIDVANICEPEQNALRLFVKEITLNRASPVRLPPPLDDAIPVEHQSDDRCFEITWDRYNVYQVLNESFDSGDGPDEVYEGNLFRKYIKSRYLRFVWRDFQERRVPGSWTSALGNSGAESHSACDQQRGAADSRST